MMRRRWWGLAGALLLAGGVHAAVPRTIHYQGRLTQSDGTPITGAFTVTLRLYDAPTGGARLWEEQHTLSLTRTDNGVFSVTLGAAVPFDEAITFDEPVWLTTEVNDEGELSPRQLLAAVSYAINADTVDGLHAAQLIAAAEAGEGAITAAQLAPNSVGATALSPSAIQPGDIEVGDLPAHEHPGVESLAASGQAALTGDVVLAAGANVSLAQAGQTITVEAAGGGTGGQHASAYQAGAVELATGTDTEVASVAITKPLAGSALLILGTVELTHTGNPNNKTVDVKLFRDGAQVGASYTARIGTANQTVSQLPVTVHAVDNPGAGTYTMSLKARSSGNNVEASARRITVIELP
jgi:hypothetical protein